MFAEINTNVGLNICEVTHTLLRDNPRIYNTNNQFRLTPNGTWYTCREQLHNDSKSESTSSFYFGTNHIATMSIVIDWVERALNVHPKHRLKIYLCGNKKEAVDPQSVIAENKQGTYFFDMEGFWTRDRLRFYFLTALIRSNSSGVWSHPLDLILSNHYYTATRRALGLFLNGYTLRSGNIERTKSNWCNQMGQRNNTHLLRRPTAPKDKKLHWNESPIPVLTTEEKYRITKWMQEAEPAKLEKHEERFIF